jgi:predicted HTH domain antitoxin
MTIELPDVNIGSQPLTSEQARIEIACGLYAGWKATMTQAARIAGMPRIVFMEELGSRKISRQYRAEDVEHDMRVAEELAAKKIAA